MGRFLNHMLDPRRAGGKKIEKFPKQAFKKAFSLIILIAVVGSSFTVIYSYNTPMSIHNNTGTNLNGSPIVYSNSMSSTGIEIPLVHHIFPNFNGKSYSINTNSTEDNLGAGIVGTGGNIYNIFANVGLYNSTKSTTWINYGNVTSSVFTLIVASDNISGLVSDLTLNSGITSGMSSTLIPPSYWNLIPGVIVIMVYNGTLSQTTAKAQSEINGLASHFSWSNEGLLFKFSMNGGIFGLNSSNKSLFLYDFTASTYKTENDIVASMSNIFNMSGSNSILSSELANGHLVPGYTPLSVDSSIFISGFIDSSLFSSKIMKYIGFNSTFSSGNELVFDGGLFAQNNVIHSSSSFHNFPASLIFSYNNNITFSQTGTNYALLIGAPNINSTGKENYNFSLYSTYSGFSGQFNGSITSNTVPVGSNFSPRSISVKSNFLYPANLNIKTKITNISSSIFEIRTTVTNLDNNTLYNLSLNETSLIYQYNESLSVVSGSPIYNDTSPLSPGGSITLNYSVAVQYPGTYTICTPLVHYIMNGKSYNVSGNTTSFSKSPPFVGSSVNMIYYKWLNVIAIILKMPIITKELLPGFYVFDILPLFLVLIDIPIEMKAYKRWKAQRKP
ncbi:MAG: autotransporter outer membrane beta-barrel domain-containing protein [Thermoplasmataceae archaeon]